MPGHRVHVATLRQFGRNGNRGRGVGNTARCMTRADVGSKPTGSSVRAASADQKHHPQKDDLQPPNDEKQSACGRHRFCEDRQSLATTHAAPPTCDCLLGSRAQRTRQFRNRRGRSILRLTGDYSWHGYNHSSGAGAGSCALVRRGAVRRSFPKAVTKCRLSVGAWQRKKSSSGCTRRCWSCEGTKRSRAQEKPRPANHGRGKEDAAGAWAA